MCVFDLLKLFGVLVLTCILDIVFCLCMLTLVALRGARGVANPSLFSFRADLVSLVGVYIRLFFGVMGRWLCWMFSLPILGVSGTGVFGVFFNGVFLSSMVWHTLMVGISKGFAVAMELRLICFSFMPSCGGKFDIQFSSEE